MRVCYCLNRVMQIRDLAARLLAAVKDAMLGKCPTS